MWLLLLTLIAAEDVAPAKQEVPIEVKGDVKVTNKQIEEVKVLAKKAYAGEVEHIYVVEGSRQPIAYLEFEVYFKDEIVGSYAIRRWFKDVIILSDRPGEDSEPILREGASLRDRVGSSVARVFKLKQTEVITVLGDGLSYELAKRLLLAIEAKDYDILPDRQIFDPEGGVNLSKVFQIDFDLETKRIEVEASRVGHAGILYEFAVHEDTFTLVSAAPWY